MSIHRKIVGGKGMELNKPLGLVLAIAAGAIVLVGASSWTEADDGNLRASKKHWDRGERETTAYPGWPADEIVVFNIAVAPVEGGWRVTWEAQLTGDYNQDGVVNILDLTPLAAHLNESVADNPALIVIDGNNDGVVNISDLMPLAAYFWSEMVGFKIELTEDLDQYPYSTVATVGFGEHKLPVEGRLEYETVITTEMTTGYLLMKSQLYPYEDWIWQETVPLPGTE